MHDAMSLYCLSATAQHMSLQHAYIGSHVMRKPGSCASILNLLRAKSGIDRLQPRIGALRGTPGTASTSRTIGRVAAMLAFHPPCNAYLRLP